MKRVTVDDVPSLWYRVLEFVFWTPALLFLLFGIGIVAFPVIGIGTVALDFEFLGSVFGAMIILLYLAFLLVHLLTPLFLYLDIRKVRIQDIEWTPTAWLYVLLSIPFGWLVVTHYLYKRHQYVVDRDRGDWWWLVVAGSLALTALSVIVPLVLIQVIGIEMVLLFAFTLAIPFVTLGFLPMALYFDSQYVRLHSEWQPNPTTKFGFSYILFFVPLATHLYATYYLFRRYSNYGLSLPS